MIHYKILIPFAILALVAVFFIGKGITGNVISQSCCMGPTCNPDDLCDSAKEYLENPLNANNDVYVGIAFILVAITLFFIARNGLKENHR